MSELIQLEKYERKVTLAIVSLVLGAVTCAGRLSLLLEYTEEPVDTNAMEKIKEKAMRLLLN